MSDQDSKSSWWQTLPGVLTAVATVITALTGLIVGLVQSHIFDSRTASTTPPAATAQLGSAPPAAPAESAAPPAAEPRLASVEPSEPRANAAAPRANGAARARESEESVQERHRPILGREIDLFTTENGGHLVAASSDTWKYTIDGDEEYHCCFYPKQNAVYAFKDGKPASFDTFASFIDATRPDNAHELELAIGNDSPVGEFKTIAKCTFQNIKMFEMPYQECKFPAVRAKYLKVTIVSNFGATGGSVYLDEFKLLGVLN